MMQLQKKDQQDIRNILNQIDKHLTQECLFCGQFLIDMVDNDIDVEGDNEFYAAQASMLRVDDEDDWKIE